MIDNIAKTFLAGGILLSPVTVEGLERTVLLDNTIDENEESTVESKAEELKRNSDENISLMLLKKTEEEKVPQANVSKDFMKLFIKKQAVISQELARLREVKGLEEEKATETVSKETSTEENVKEETIESINWITGEATAYWNAKDTMNGETGVTASGYSLDNGIYYNGYRILAMDSSIPFFTLVEIRLGGSTTMTGIVLDRGGAIKGNKIDIVMSSYDECTSFGRQSVSYRIIGTLMQK